MKPRAFLHLFVIPILIQTATASASPLVGFTPTRGSIDLLVGGKLFTRYVNRIDPGESLAVKDVLLTKPVLFPLRTPWAKGRNHGLQLADG